MSAWLERRVGVELVKARVKTRKTPYKHPVKEHKRKGKPVQKYERGKGDQAKKNSKRRSRVVGGSRNPARSIYDITVIYVGASERLEVDAKNYIGALDSGLADRDEIETPKMVRMRRER